MAQVYVWGKYNLNVKYEEDHSAHAPKQGDINNFWVGKSYSFSAVSGKYTLNNALEMSRENDAAQYPYAIDGAMAGDGVYYAEEAYGINKTAGWISSSGKLAYRIPDTLSGKIFYPVYYGAKTIKEKGVYIEDVTSESENTYPKDGISGSYYYVFKYAVPGVPSITVPGAAMIGHAVDISWEAADSAESYKLERRVDSGGWTQVYEGGRLDLCRHGAGRVVERAVPCVRKYFWRIWRSHIIQDREHRPVNYIKNIHAGRQYWGNQGGDNVYSIERRSPRRYLHFGGF